MDIRRLVRVDILDLIPYEPHPYSNVTKMDANENSHDFPQEVMTDLFTGVSGDVFSRYPDPNGDELRGEIAASIGVEKENIILGNGSDELIQLIAFNAADKRHLVGARQLGLDDMIFRQPLQLR